MRELTSEEVVLVSGGSTVDGEAAMAAGATAGALNQMARGARIGSVFGPKGALGGAIIGGAAYGVGTFWSDFRNS